MNFILFFVISGTLARYIETEMTTIESQLAEEELNRSVRDLIYWNRVYNQLKSKSLVPIFSLSFEWNKELKIIEKSLLTTFDYNFYKLSIMLEKRN